MDKEQKMNRRIFGLRLEMARKQKRLSQPQLAVRVGLDRTQIINIEVGRSSTSVDRLILLAKALGVSPAKLLKGLD